MDESATACFNILEVKQMIVGFDPAEGAVVTLKTSGQTMVKLRLSPRAVAKLEAFLAQASIAQAKHQLPQ